ncbi:MAG TPA: RES family NAD+ phosphorylase [Longimicrobium sp.]|nr:RES family NAD+ phosphorylase [Longimicrobium sp.]
MNGARRLWRVFPWDPAARDGEPFSATFVPGGQGRGRFDLPGRASGVLYAAEGPEHAVAEMIQRFRNQPAPLEMDDLVVAGHALALVEVQVSAGLGGRIANLCAPDLLARHGIAPDATAARERLTSQRVAEALLAEGYAGLRWWSAFFGEWHTTVLFRERAAAGDLAYGTPVPLDLGHAALREAARWLDVTVRQEHR